MTTVDDLATVRAGDKGDSLIVSVIARDMDAYRCLESLLTAERVAQHYAPLVTGIVVRRATPVLSAFVFMLPGLLGGGVTASPALDGHGKTLGYHLLSLQL